MLDVVYCEHLGRDQGPGHGCCSRLAQLTRQQCCHHSALALIQCEKQIKSEELTLLFSSSQRMFCSLVQEKSSTTQDFHKLVLLHQRTPKISIIAEENCHNCSSLNIRLDSRLCHFSTSCYSCLCMRNTDTNQNATQAPYY